MRVQGIDAGFFEPSYAPGDDAELEVATDARSLTFQVFAYGGGRFPSVRDLRTSGQAMTAPARVDWSSHRTRPRRSASFGPATGRAACTSSASRRRTDASATRRSSCVRAPSARTASPSCSRRRRGRRTTSRTRTSDGWGDSWYVSGRTHAIDLTRAVPRLRHPVPLRRLGSHVPHVAAADATSRSTSSATRTSTRLDRRRARAQLRPGRVPGARGVRHQNELDAVTRFRDLGGNLAFLAANNMFWHVRITAR